MPPDVREWLPERHLAWFVIDAVGEMDLEAFYAAYRVDGRSRPAYDPAMMVALLLYAYARGIRSSRVIERACEEDVAFRVMAAQQRPDHATIARFVERHQDAIAGLFGEVLTLCARSRAGEGRGDRGRRHEGAGATRAATRTSITSSSRARSSRRPRPSTRPRTSSTARRAATSCRRAVAHRRRGAAAWLREAKQPAGGERAAEARPVPRSRPASASRRPSGAWTRSSGPRCAPTGPTSLPGARAHEGRAPLRPPAESLHAAGRSRRAQINVTDPDSHVVKGCAAAGSCRATTRRRSPTSTRS